MDTCRPIRFICIIMFFLSTLAGTAGCTGTTPASPAVPVPPSALDSGSVCNPESRALIPVDTSIPVRDTMPGIKYSITENESGRTIVLDKGDIFEINLRWIPSLDLHWSIPVSGCGIELVNNGTFSGDGDFWNTTGIYRARYRAIRSGTSVLDGTFGSTPGGMAKGMPQFNLTVIVK